MDFLHGKSTYSIGYVNSDESDYQAKTMFAGVSHDMFGDLTTISFSFKNGKNDVFRNVKIDGVQVSNDPGVPGRDGVARATASALSQIITKNLVLTGQYEVITDEGWLNSPYRSVRFFIGTDQQGQQPEAVSEHAFEQCRLDPRQVLPALSRRASTACTASTPTPGASSATPASSVTCIRSTRPGCGGNWIFEGRVRYYTQSAADFYKDIFPRADFSNFMARDKELATYNAITAGVGATYEFKIERFPWLTKGQINFRYDHMMVSYDDFRDARFSLGSFGSSARRSAARPAPSRCTSCRRTSSSSTSARSSDAGRRRTAGQATKTDRHTSAPEHGCIVSLVVHRVGHD